ncbi:MAG: phosphodiester glycosidase family protein, partial [Candidatus Saccharibacteria bacterium]
EVATKSTQLTREVLYSRSHSGDKFFVAKVDSTRQLRVVLAHDQVGGKLETVASMCRRYHCLVGINGDFFGGPVAVGGISIAGHVLRTPYSHHGQIMLRRNGVAFIGHTNDQRVGFISGGLHVPLPLNIDPALGMSSIYTNVYGGTLTAGPGISTRIYRCRCNERPDKYGVSYRFALKQVVSHGVIHLARNEIVVLGRGVQAHTFAVGAGQTALAQMPRFSESDAIGANPVIMTRGKVSSSLVDSFSTSGHPRSVFARNTAGKTWLIAIDTRVTLIKAAQIAKKMGATEAINLDGGGSTTFVIRGNAVNNPADKAERAVSSAILVVQTITRKSHILAPKTAKAVAPRSYVALATPDAGAMRVKPNLAPAIRPQVVAVRYKAASSGNSTGISIPLGLLASFFLVFDLYFLWREYQRRR